MNDEHSITWRRAHDCDSGECIEVAYSGGVYLLRASTNPEGPILRFTPDEWAVFTRGVRNGEFDFH